MCKTAVFAREVLEEALKSLEGDDGVFLNADGQEISPDDLDLEDFDEDREGGPAAFSVRTALMDEKIAAAEVRVRTPINFPRGIRRT